MSNIKIFKKELFKFVLFVLATGFIVVMSWRFLYDIESFNMTFKLISLPVVIVIVALIFRSELSQLLLVVSKVNYKDVEISTTRSREGLLDEAKVEITQIPSVESFYSNKEEVEKLMQVASDWGYGMAQIGFTMPPKLALEWENSKPIIKYGFSHNSSFDEDKRNLINDIKKIRRELDGLSAFDKYSMGILPSKEQVLRKDLERTRSHLREIDPESIYLKD